MRTRTRWVSAAAVLVIAASACGNSKSQSSPTTQATTATTQGGTTTTADLKKFVKITGVKGVSDTEIKVAIITSKTNPIGGKYAQLADGIKAYFKMINDAGGIYGRKLVISKERDDVIGLQNTQQVQASLADDSAFATFLATLQFSGADLLAKAGQPTFIWNINPEMASTPTVPHTNIFAERGALCFTCAGHFLPWLATTNHFTKVGILAYGISASSKTCAAGTRAGYEKYAPTVKVVTFDDSLQFGADLAADVANLKSNGAQFVTTCMDTNEVVKLAQTMQQQGVAAVQNLPNGYDHVALAQSGNLYEGNFLEPGYVPIEDSPQSPATKEYLDHIGAITDKPVELSETGWILAKEFVDGLKLAGPDFTQRKLIDALNTQTDYSAGGMIVPIDWTKAHDNPITHPESRSKYECAAVLKVVGGKFVPTYTQPGKPWICFDPDPNAPIPVDPQHVSFAPDGQG
jgi:ABC-type branched-subunit amino acid transport system substrate-binding protein